MAKQNVQTPPELALDHVPGSVRTSPNSDAQTRQARGKIVQDQLGRRVHSDQGSAVRAGFNRKRKEIIRRGHNYGGNSENQLRQDAPLEGDNSKE